MSIMKKLELEQSPSGIWQFFYHEEIEEESVVEKFYHGVDLLDIAPDHAELIFKELIKTFPYYINAYAHLSLAFKNQEKFFESLITAEKGYQIGKNLFPKKFKLGKDTLEWSVFSNRPFLRATLVYAMELGRENQILKSIELCEEILLLNKNDHQGTRDYLLSILADNKLYDQAIDLIKRYPEEPSINFRYVELGLGIIKNWKQDVLKGLLDRAIKANEHLPSILMARNPKEPILMDRDGPAEIYGIPIGTKLEAYWFFKEHKNFLKQKKIKLWLNENMVEIPLYDPIELLKRS